MENNKCKDIKSGSYDCYESTEYGFKIDKCLIKEINELNNRGIKTIGCCCGHDRGIEYIQVSPSFIPKMIALEYEKLPIDKNGHGQWCFKPKTKFTYIGDWGEIILCSNCIYSEPNKEIKLQKFAYICNNNISPCKSNKTFYDFGCNYGKSK